MRGARTDDPIDAKIKLAMQRGELTTGQAMHAMLHPEEYRAQQGAAWSAEAISAADIARNGVQSIQMDILALLEANDGPVLMFGNSGSFKSWIALFIGAALLHGAAFLGRATRRRPFVIYLNFDSGGASLARRIAMMRLHDDNFVIISPTDGWDELEFEKLLALHPESFVVIDCLSDVLQVDAAQDTYGAQTRAFLRWLRTTYAKHGANGIIIDHAKRPDRLRKVEPGGVFTVDYIGSNQKRAAVRQMWAVELVADEHGDPSKVVQVRCEKANESETFASFRLSFDFDGDRVALVEEPMASAQVSSRKVTAVDRALEAMVGLVDEAGPATRADLGADSKGSSTRRTALKGAVQNGTLVSLGGRPEKFGRPEKAKGTCDRVCDQSFDDTVLTGEKARFDAASIVTTDLATTVTNHRDQMTNSPLGVGHGHNGHNDDIDDEVIA